jgi:glycerophosphoryl diester phosphodiesterase
MRPLVIGHRGSPQTEPENTLSSFRRALEEGADAIEVDVRTTSDGALVAFHDETLDRVTGRSGELASLDRAALSSLRVEGRGKVPGLDEVLGLGARTMVDVKAAAPAAVLEALDSAGARARAWICSFDHSFLEEARALGAGPLGYLIRPGTMFSDLDGRKKRPDGLGFVLDPLGQEEMVEIEALEVPAGSMLNVPHFMLVNEPDFAARLVAHFQQRRIKLNVWTVNEEAEVRTLARLGVDGIITDRPATAIGAL